MTDQRYNIGLLVASIADDFSKRLTIGAMEAARELDVNMVVFPGKYVGVQHINEHYEAEYEYQYNALFDIAVEAKLDYLIVAVGTIAYAHNNEFQKAFLDRLGDTPILSVAAGIEGYDCLQFDNRSGVTEAVNYLAAHGRKHIGMIAGDINNAGFADRADAYMQALAANGLNYRDGYMLPCNLAIRCYDEVERLLDANPELDAIVCATDLIANDVYEVLRRRGLRAGIDIAVVGFDDLPMDIRMDPPLASVRADAIQLGKRAVLKAFHRLSGIPDDEQFVRTGFIPRRSCFKYVDDVAVTRKLFSGSYEDMLGHIRAYFAQRCENGTATQADCDLIVGFLTHLHEHYESQPVQEKTVGETMALLSGVAPLRSDPGLNRILHGTYLWQLRNCHAANLPYLEMRHQSVWEDPNASTLESIARQYQERSHIGNEFVRDALMFGGNLKDNYARIMRKLNSLGAVTAFLYTFETPVRHCYGDTFPRGLSWLFQAYSYGRDVFSPSRAERRMTTPTVFDHDHLCRGRRHTFIVADLFSAEMQYGIALLEPRDDDFLDELELVTYQLSSAVRTLNILRKQEKLLQELHASNLALERMSKIDELTGVCNRKGFYPAAEKLISNPRYQDHRFIVCFADLDDLKGINDTYGHAEGDFSIRLVTECLSSMLGEDAVIGRMGGDEFAAIVPLPPDTTIGTLNARKEAFIRRFNDSGEKPYRFDVSVGLRECLCDSADDLRDALNRADDLLYREKSIKKAATK